MNVQPIYPEAGETQVTSVRAYGLACSLFDILQIVTAVNWACLAQMYRQPSNDILNFTVRYRIAWPISLLHCNCAKYTIFPSRIKTYGFV